MGALRALLLMAAAGWAGAARLRGDGGKAQSSSQRRFLLPDLHDDTLPFQANESAAVSTRTPMRAEFVSWAPRIVHLHDFLSQGEADHIVNLARANMVRSTVVDSAHGTQASVVDEIRTARAAAASHARLFDAPPPRASSRAARGCPERARPRVPPPPGDEGPLAAAPAQSDSCEPSPPRGRRRARAPSSRPRKTRCWPTSSAASRS